MLNVHLCNISLHFIYKFFQAFNCCNIAKNTKPTGKKHTDEKSLLKLRKKCCKNASGKKILVLIEEKEDFLLDFRGSLDQAINNMCNKIRDFKVGYNIMTRNSMTIQFFYAVTYQKSGENKDL